MKKRTAIQISTTPGKKLIVKRSRLRILSMPTLANVAGNDAIAPNSLDSKCPACTETVSQ